jgi:Xaa-Pro aminopeptidase
LQELIEQHNIKTLYTETSKTSIEQYKTLTDMLNCEISKENRLDRHILNQRRSKTTDEVDKIKQAQKITDNTFSHILNHIKVGKSEREIMLEMEFYLRKQGSEGVSFDFIVVSGKNSSLPHGKPTEKLIENGVFITMDFGAVIGGYRSDMTRTVAVGSVSEYQKLVYNTVLDAQKQALAAIRPGAICKDIDKIARSFIANNGFDGYFGHGLGHSVGIDVHESPSFNTVDDSVLEPGMVLTVEPGIYLPNQFGVRIEDMVLITKNGLENLTNSPKELIIL